MVLSWLVMFFVVFCGFDISAVFVFSKKDMDTDGRSVIAFGSVSSIGYCPGSLSNRGRKNLPGLMEVSDTDCDSGVSY